MTVIDDVINGSLKPTASTIQMINNQKALCCKTPSTVHQSIDFMTAFGVIAVGVVIIASIWFCYKCFARAQMAFSAHSSQPGHHIATTTATFNATQHGITANAAHTVVAIPLFKPRIAKSVTMPSMA